MLDQLVIAAEHWLLLDLPPGKRRLATILKSCLTNVAMLLLNIHLTRL